MSAGVLAYDEAKVITYSAEKLRNRVLVTRSPKSDKWLTNEEQPMFITNSGTLQEIEAEKIYRSIFYQRAPDIVRQRFIEASDRLNQKVSSHELERYYRVIQIIDDLEALELACRYTKKLPLLSLKFHLMIFLAETLPENQRFFINERTSFVKGLFFLVIGFLKTIYKVCKGFYLLVRLNHV